MKIKTISLVSLSLLISCGASDVEKKKSNSILQEISAQGKVKFTSLPLEGAAIEDNRLWSGDHWPMNKSSINYRWQTGNTNSLEYTSPSLEELQSMSEEEISYLSPSEKYDILMGDYNYSLKKFVQDRTNIAAMAWEGVGDGWAAATTLHGEPGPVTLTNKDNLVISFGSSDVKALLSYYYSAFHKTAQEQMGLRCNTAQEEASEDKSCNDDLTPAQLHIALARTLGNKQTIIMDIDRFDQVWNHPITSFSATILSKGDPSEKAPSGTTQTIAIKNKVTYLDRSYNHAWNPVKGTWNQVSTNRIYSYQLHLNSKGEIIGSTWGSFDRPDFLWIPSRVQKFEGKLSGLNQILKGAQTESTPETGTVEEGDATEN